MPVFLKRYTSFHVYVRCMTQGVEILQRLRHYNEAVILLKRLLKQKVFCQDYRGRWWDRLALNLEQHLKKPQEAIEAIREGLQDKNVRVGHRYSLLTRALRILKSTNENDDFKKEILKAADVIDTPKVTIRGRLFPKTILGRRHVFISSSATAEDNDDITVLGVEALAIEHYKSQGFTEGVHGEGSTFISLYALLFWDIIYDGSIPDVFISPYQTHPLDLNSDSFFHTREKLILSHLENMRLSTTEELKEIVKTTWENHFGKSSLVSWDRFTDVDHVKGLVACMGNSLLCGICERLARDFRFTRSGVPDLVVWNPETSLVKIVEVKGPGDKLSSKQILWLDYLIKLGADAEVCLVEAVGSKKLRKE
ncbi:Fanconi-associated nuclease 1, partial [Stegodyphus mimosarum]